jgi:ABC-type phosphate transport system substrate-binding protein
MAAGQYPFVSDIYFHDLQGYSGLASGFVAWIYSQPGQTIIKKSGLLPARDMGRTIEISTEY